MKRKKSGVKLDVRWNARLWYVSGIVVLAFVALNLGFPNEALTAYAVLFPSEMNCRDSDLSKDYAPDENITVQVQPVQGVDVFTLGNTQGIFRKGGRVVFGEFVHDSCASDTILLEQYCREGDKGMQQAHLRVICPGKCVDGKCVLNADIGIASLSIEPLNPLVNQSITLRAVVKNFGSTPFDTSSVVARWHGLASDAGMLSLGIIPAGESREVTKELSYETSGNHYIVLKMQTMDLDEYNDRKQVSFRVRLR